MGLLHPWWMLSPSRRARALSARWTSHRVAPGVRTDAARVRWRGQSRARHTACWRSNCELLLLPWETIAPKGELPTHRRVHESIHWSPTPLRHLDVIRDWLFLRTSHFVPNGSYVKTSTSPATSAEKENSAPVDSTNVACTTSPACVNRYFLGASVGCRSHVPSLWSSRSVVRATHSPIAFARKGGSSTGRGPEGASRAADDIGSSSPDVDGDALDPHAARNMVRMTSVTGATLVRRRRIIPVRIGKIHAPRAVCPWPCDCPRWWLREGPHAVPAAAITS